MGNELTDWLSVELKERHWSYGELAQRAGLSQSMVSKTIKGKKKTSANFCIKVAQALDEPPERLLRLAGHLSSSVEHAEDSPAIKDLLGIARDLAPDCRWQLLDYARYLQAKQVKIPK